MLPSRKPMLKLMFKLMMAIALATAAFAWSTPAAESDETLSGTFDCAKVEINGKARPCKAPSLELNSDGSYQILSERGTYEIVAGHWLVLSKNRGKARLSGGKYIIFEFVSGGKKSKITYRRKYERPSGWVSS